MTISDADRSREGFDVIVCLSGGVDSIVATRLCQLAGLRCAALHFNLHGPSSPAELKAARGFCEQWQVPLEIVDFCPSQTIPFARQADEFFGPLMFLMLGSCLAMSTGSQSVALGLTAEQVEAFVADARWPAAKSILSTIRFPLKDLSKPEVLRRAAEVDLLLEETWSCVAACDTPCGQCFACRDRLHAEV
jgi:7-cyano-7-deazaguanine synthase in queuosine biosynthesis